MSDLTKYYEVLGLEPTATAEEIKQAYRDLTKVWHPDRFAHDPRLQQKAQEKLKEINHAYDNLKNIASQARNKNGQARSASNNERKERSEESGSEQQYRQNETAKVDLGIKVTYSYTKMIIGLLTILIIIAYWGITRKKTDNQSALTQPQVAVSGFPAATIVPTTPSPKNKVLSAVSEPYQPALDMYLQSHPELVFIKEGEFDQESLKWMRNEPYFGKGFSPYYRVGDFNRDGHKDFAVILKNIHKSKKDPLLADTHQRRYQVSLIVFNGVGEGQFRVAYEEHKIDAPLVCFVHVPEGEKGLFFGVFETDDGFVLTPKGQGYKSESVEEYNDKNRK